MLAAENGKVQAVRCLIKKGANPALRHRTGWNSLHIASRYGHVDVIELLVSHMTDIDSEDAWGWTIVSQAIKNEFVCIPTLQSKWAFQAH